MVDRKDSYQVVAYYNSGRTIVHRDYRSFDNRLLLFDSTIFVDDWMHVAKKIAVALRNEDGPSQSLVSVQDYTYENKLVKSSTVRSDILADQAGMPEDNGEEAWRKMIEKAEKLPVLVEIKYTYNSSGRKIEGALDEFINGKKKSYRLKYIYE